MVHRRGRYPPGDSLRPPGDRGNRGRSGPKQDYRGQRTGPGNRYRSPPQRIESWRTDDRHLRLRTGYDLSAENANLASNIINQGALISEYPLGAKPRPDNFPRRNRIMSGMSLGVLVIEADESSGAMITAHMALEQNREVFAIPGSILSPMSRGTNSLIQEGAKLVRNCTDILEELNLTASVHQMEMKEIIPDF